MTGATATIDRPADRIRNEESPGVGKLAAIELRKIRDTRAGKWLLGLTALLTVGFVLIVLLTGDASERGFGELIALSMMPVSFLPPILAILAITSEWSQRSGLTTFALVPRRGRVIAAKLIATTTLALAVVALAVVACAVGAAISGGEGSVSALEAIGYGIVFQVLFVTMGAAFGLAFMSSPVAIVLFFLLPSILSALGGLIDWLREPLQWVDPNSAWLVLTEPPAGGEDLAQVAVAAAVMIGLPLVAGLVRLRRTEIK
ncbi:ABC transporter permease subunit [Thermoleophilia bacterium SCSIO 60948]|nr:ABC transporter permease subunit [Thermoleophilia bacterium SCSIO 60948]